jgi:hypothetical protein
MWQRFVQALLYPWVYVMEQRSLLKRQEQLALSDALAEMQERQLEMFKQMQENSTQLMGEVVKTSTAAADVMRTWLEGFKQVEIPQAHELSKSDEQLLEELKAEYRLENPDSESLHEMTRTLLEGFNFDQ